MAMLRNPIQAEVMKVKANPKSLKVLGILASLLTIVSVAMANSASCYWVYQPKTPKCLQK